LARHRGLERVPILSSLNWIFLWKKQNSASNLIFYWIFRKLSDDLPEGQGLNSKKYP
jgi:hypothetical protein